jgi:hypothetical protein
LTLLSDLHGGIVTFQGIVELDQSIGGQTRPGVAITSYLPPATISSLGSQDQDDYASASGIASQTAYKSHIFFSFIVKSLSNSQLPIVSPARPRCCLTSLADHYVLAPFVVAMAHQKNQYFSLGSVAFYLSIRSIPMAPIKLSLQ